MNTKVLEWTQQELAMFANVLKMRRILTLNQSRHMHKSVHYPELLSPEKANELIETDTRIYLTEKSQCDRVLEKNKCGIKVYVPIPYEGKVIGLALSEYGKIEDLFNRVNHYAITENQPEVIADFHWWPVNFQTFENYDEWRKDQLDKAGLLIEKHLLIAS